MVLLDYQLLIGRSKSLNEDLRGGSTGKDLESLEATPSLNVTAKRASIALHSALQGSGVALAQSPVDNYRRTSLHDPPTKRSSMSPPDLLEALSMSIDEDELYTKQMVAPEPPKCKSPTDELDDQDYTETTAPLDGSASEWDDTTAIVANTTANTTKNQEEEETKETNDDDSKLPAQSIEDTASTSTPPAAQVSTPPAPTPAAQEATPPLLPPGWYEAIDPHTGSSYYWKEQDGTYTTTWERPKEEESSSNSSAKPIHKKKQKQKLTPAQIAQNERQVELDELFVLYGIDPSTISPDEIPGPLPDWTPKAYPPPNDYDSDEGLYSDEEEEEEEEDASMSASLDSSVSSSLNSSDQIGSSLTSFGSRRSSLSGGSRKSALASGSNSPKRNFQVVRFLVDPMTDDDDEDDLANMDNNSSRRKTEFAKKGRSHSMDEYPKNARRRRNSAARIRRSNSLPTLLKNQSWRHSTEQKMMMDAQQSLTSLSPDAMAELLNMLVKQDNNSTRDINDLRKNTPEGCFIVESTPGVYHALSSQMLMEFVATRATSRRRHQVGNVTVLKEIAEVEEEGMSGSEHETQDNKDDDDEASISLRDRVIYEV